MDVIFVIHGRKLVFQSLGFVADFCPICREPQPFAIRRVGLARHIFLATASSGAEQGFEGICRKCGVTIPMQRSDYGSPATKEIPLPNLIEQTFPNLAHAREAELEFARKLREEPATIPPALRKRHLRQPFLLLSRDVERRFANTHIDLDCALALLAGIGLFALASFLPTAIPRYFPSLPYQLGEKLAAFSVLLAFALIAWQFMGARRRFLRRHILPIASKALRPMHPTEEELAAVRDDLRRDGKKMGAHLHLADLRALLQAS